MVYALLPFVVLPVNSISVVSKFDYQVIAQMNDVQNLSFTMLRDAVHVIVRVWLSVVDKPTLLSTAQVDGLLKELVEVEDEEGATVTCTSFVGGCVLQAATPNSLSMQRLSATILKPASQHVKSLWQGEMPFLQ